MSLVSVSFITSSLVLLGAIYLDAVSRKSKGLTERQWIGRKVLEKKDKTSIPVSDSWI